MFDLLFVLHWHMFLFPYNFQHFLASAKYIFGVLYEHFLFFLVNSTASRKGCSTWQFALLLITPLEVFNFACGYARHLRLWNFFPFQLVFRVFLFLFISTSTRRVPFWSFFVFFGFGQLDIILNIMLNRIIFLSEKGI